jgi:hypothetical protein
MDYFALKKAWEDALPYEEGAPGEKNARGGMGWSFQWLNLMSSSVHLSPPAKRTTTT